MQEVLGMNAMLIGAAIFGFGTLFGMLVMRYSR